MKIVLKSGSLALGITLVALTLAFALLMLVASGLNVWIFWNWDDNRVVALISLRYVMYGLAAMLAGSLAAAPCFHYWEAG